MYKCCSFGHWFAGAGTRTPNDNKRLEKEKKKDFHHRATEGAWFSLEPELALELERGKRERIKHRGHREHKAFKLLKPSFNLCDLCVLCV
jgi:hypothetical protein